LHIWCVPLTLKEVVAHPTEKMLELILDAFQQINEIQCDQGLHQSQIYEIMTVKFDLTSANTSWLDGLGKKLRRSYTRLHRRRTKPVEPFLIVLGLLLIFLHC